MKLNLDKRWIIASVALLIIVVFITLSIQNKDALNQMTLNETSTESPISQDTTEVVSNTPEHDYFYVRPKLQRRVIAIRELDDSELPTPFDFTESGIESYEDLHFYALVILDIDTDVRLNTETITEVAQLETINTLDSKGIEQVYKQLEIRYVVNHAVYKHDRQYFVTSLTEPRLYKKYAIYDTMIPIEPTYDATSIDVYRTSSSLVIFSPSQNHFIKLQGYDNLPVTDNFSWEGKTILHKPALTSVQSPSFSKITDEPRLNQFTLGASSAVVFERLGMPKKVDWLMGYYLNYEDLLIFSVMEENEDAFTFQPISSILYFGEYPVVGIQKGMTFKEVEQIIGPQSTLFFSEVNEMTYPLSVTYKKDGFSIGIGFDSKLTVSQFFIRSADDANDVVYEPMPNEIESAFSEELFKSNGLEQFTDFTTGFDNCYFNASAVTIGCNAAVDSGFYTYDLSRQTPTLMSDQPMKMVFELLHDANPSVITIGKEDGILYKIDLNTFVQTQMSGPNYKDYVVSGGAVIKASLLSDTAFLGNYGFSVKETIGQFEVDVPKDWNVKYGDYPEGLYWSLANVFSSDVGLDISALKGKTVDATVYRLEDGLKGSNAVILRENNQIKGAWLMFNTSSIGPSLNVNYLEDITSDTFNDWVWDEGIFTMTTSYNPSPDATINTFFEAIQSGNKKKANACLMPSSFLDALTTNLDFSKRLYHEGFNTDNSLVENIVSASDIEILSYFENQTFKPIENSQAYYDAMPLGTRVEVELSLNLDWREGAFNTEGKDTRFAVLEKTPFGWKLDGLATGR